MSARAQQQGQVQQLPAYDSHVPMTPSARIPPTTVPMTPEDLAICREVHAGMTSKERNRINYLFLEPVDHAFFQDYLDVVRRPMDLR
jgi:hypothetical protein